MWIIASFLAYVIISSIILTPIIHRYKKRKAVRLIEIGLPNDLHALRRIMRKYSRLSIFLEIAYFFDFRNVAFWGLGPFDVDMLTIRKLDKMRRRGEDIPVPNLNTEEGRLFWAHYVDVCFGKQMICQAEYEKRLSSFDKWHCTCGRENEGYVSTCVCGKSKRKGVPQ